MSRTMTRQEAIYQIKNLAVLSITSITESLSMAIEALEQEPSEDCISRKWVLKKIKTYAEACTTSTGESVGADCCAEFVEDAPSVVLKRGKWIADRYCSECEWDKKDADYTSGWTENYCPNCGARMESGEQ